jgi:hypothetical protein
VMRPAYISLSTGNERFRILSKIQVATLSSISLSRLEWMVFEIRINSLSARRPLPLTQFLLSTLYLLLPLPLPLHCLPQPPYCPHQLLSEWFGCVTSTQTARLQLLSPLLPLLSLPLLCHKGRALLLGDLWRPYC